VLRALQLHPRSGPQRHRRPVRRDDHIGRLAVLALAASALGLAACGGDSSSGGEVEPRAGVTVAALGDSITAGSPGYDPDPAQRAELGFGDDRQSQYEYWAEQADASLRFRNCGVFGERTDEIAKRLETCAKGAEVLIVQGGINDIAQGYPTVQAADQLRLMVARGRELGLEVFLANLLPWNNGHPAADEPIAELNRLIARIGSDDHVRVLDFHGALADPADPALMAPELTADGDHPSIAGYRRLGELVAERLERLGIR
jgi:lysophospholipase L1-like esterase